MFHCSDGLYFTRRANGSVIIEKTNGPPPSEGGVVLFYHVLDAGAWCSVVLSMTAFGERTGDWHVFQPHHQGKKDILEALK